VVIHCHSFIHLADIFNLNFDVKNTHNTFLSFQIDCHDSGTESDGDLDTEDFNERDIELSEYFSLIFSSH
jgi:hypothetical protein